MVYKPSNITLLNMWWLILYMQISGKYCVVLLAPKGSNVSISFCLLSVLPTFVNLIPLSLFFSYLSLTVLLPSCFLNSLSKLTWPQRRHKRGRTHAAVSLNIPVDLLQPIPFPRSAGPGDRVLCQNVSENGGDTGWGWSLLVIRNLGLQSNLQSS